VFSVALTLLGTYMTLYNSLPNIIDNDYLDTRNCVDQPIRKGILWQYVNNDYDDNISNGISRRGIFESFI
jgi:hypothetical protein